MSNQKKLWVGHRSVVQVYEYISKDSQYLYRIQELKASEKALVFQEVYLFRFEDREDHPVFDRELVFIGKLQNELPGKDHKELISQYEGEEAEVRLVNGTVEGGPHEADVPVMDELNSQY